MRELLAEERCYGLPGTNGSFCSNFIVLTLNKHQVSKTLLANASTRDFGEFTDDMTLIACTGTDIIAVLCAQGASLRAVRAICKLFHALSHLQVWPGLIWTDLDVPVGVGWNRAAYIPDNADDRIVCVRDVDDRKPMRDRQQDGYRGDVRRLQDMPGSDGTWQLSSSYTASGTRIVP